MKAHDMELCRLLYATGFLIQIVENKAATRVNTSVTSEAIVPSSASTPTWYLVDYDDTKVDPKNLPRDHATDGRIIDGVPAVPGEFPFMISIQHAYSWTNFCGGSLVTNRHVLTACHCITYSQIGYKPRPKSTYTISLLAGTVNIDSNSRHKGARRDAWLLRHHPDCIKLATGWTWDFGMITVRGEFPNEPGLIEIIPLPPFINYSIPNMASSEVACTALGWGRTSAYKEDQKTLILLKVELKLQPEDVCYELLLLQSIKSGSELRYNEATQVCTLGEGSKDACQGDSGGPLVCVTEQETHILTAIVSWGIGCGRPSVPGIWARLDIAESWIREVMAGAGYNAPSYLAVFAVLTMAIKTIHSALSSCCLLV